VSQEPRVVVRADRVTVVSAGTQGPPGAPGAGDLNHTHTQLFPADVWTVAHGLPKRPSVTVVDTAGTEVLADVAYPSLGTVEIRFAAPMSGSAFLN
jgi:hypothetical protein